MLEAGKYPGPGKLFTSIMDQFQIKRDREVRNIKSQRDLALFLNTDQTFISGIQTGRRPIGDGFVCKVSEATGWPVKKIRALIADNA